MTSNRYFYGFQPPTLSFTWFGSGFRWKKERGNTRLHIYRPNTTFSGRKSWFPRWIWLRRLRLRLGHGKRKKSAADRWGQLVSEARERARSRYGSWAGPRERDREREKRAQLRRPNREGKKGQAGSGRPLGRRQQVRFLFFLFLFFSNLNLFPKPFK
jgi:hypothetical protein